VIVLVGTKNILRQPTTTDTKNVLVKDNQIVISRSTIQPTVNNIIVLTDQDKDSDKVLDSDKDSEPETPVASDDDDKTTMIPLYRVAVVYRTEPEPAAGVKDQEQFGLWGAGWGTGWRFPLGYWNTFGSGLYGGGCGLGFPMGGFYYC